MKMEHKRMLLIAGCIVACIVLVAVIGSQFGKPQEAAQTVAESTTEAERVNVVLEPDSETQEESEAETTEATQKETETVVVRTESAAPAENGETKAVVAAQTDKVEQVIQPSPEKPTAPPEEVLKDPTQKPDGETVEGTPAAQEHEAVVQPDEPPTKANEPQAGDTQNGQIYIPGFGWVEDHGGGGAGTVADDMYENGNKIGIMD